MAPGYSLGEKEASERHAWRNGFGLGAAFFPVQALVGYFYASMSVFGMTTRSGYMSVPTAAALLCGATALLLRTPRRGIMAILTGATEASNSLRRMTLFLVAVPLATGWVALFYVRDGEHTVEDAVGTVALITIVLLVTLTWMNAFGLNRVEEALREAKGDMNLCWRGPTRRSGIGTCRKSAWYSHDAGRN